MCGFHFICSAQRGQRPTQLCLDLLKCRGPDSTNILDRSIPVAGQQSLEHSTEATLYFSIVSTVLSLRGDFIVSQPLVDSASGSMLCWNGEAWRIGNDLVAGNDSEAVFDAFMRISSHYTQSQEGTTGTESRDHYALALKATLQSIQGPFAFWFYDAFFQRIFYGRDPLGRRSLLVQSTGERFSLTSVANGSSHGPWFEVDANSFHELDLRYLTTEYSVTNKGSGNKNIASNVTETHFGMRSVINPIYASECETLNRTRFSPGLDHESYKQTNLTELHRRIYESLATRLADLPASHGPGHSRVAILFSGGLDCSLIARLCHSILPCNEMIDLLNVAFENPRVLAAAKSEVEQSVSPDVCAFSGCPDRITGLKSYNELEAVCPGRKWNFIAVDVAFSEMMLHKNKVISLMYPHNTEMDLSISLPLYFAARGKGRCIERSMSKDYTSNALVLLSGLGADELFGGYTRHENAFKARGEQGLLDELALDFKRIGKRNLGRDDRVTSHWGREVRHPYLDENVISWALSRPPWEKYGFVVAANDGYISGRKMLNVNKLVLRLLAIELGIPSAADEKKRAIQFGARSAKMVDNKAKGTQIVR